jgi:hypothetical protein
MIEYTYNIISVDQAARCMEVVYSSPGRQTLHIGARLPYENETLDTILQMYAPIAHWLEAEQKTQAPPISSGSLVYTPPAEPEPIQAARLRRNMLLTHTDWTQLPDAPLSSEQRAVWVEYRQELRNVPTQPGFPNQIIWPVAPNSSMGTDIPVVQL